MPRYFLTLSFNGSAFNGWQIQENTPSTVQQVLQEKLSMLLRQPVEVVGCGRTDTGVHARNFVAHFDSSLPIDDPSDMLYRLNTVLPASIATHRLRQVHSTAHARFDATERAYTYFLRRAKDPFRSQYSWYVHGEIDFDAMNEAAACLTRHQDFTSFSKLNTQNKTNRCTITTAKWLRSGAEEWMFRIRADRFLRGMVRAIVGTLLMVGRNKLDVTGFENVIKARDRKAAGNNAPAQGLFFSGVAFPEKIYVGAS